MSETNFFILGVIYLSGIMAPGLSINLIIRNALLHGKITSLISVAGTILAITIQSSVALFTIDSLTDDTNLFLKKLASVILIGMGISMVFIKEKISSSDKSAIFQNYKQAFFQGFIVEIINPMALSFFITIMSSFITDNNYINFLYIIEIIILGFLWFGSIALISSSQVIALKIKKYLAKVKIISGLIFIYFGIVSVM